MISFLLFNFSPEQAEAEQATININENETYEISGLNLYYGSPANILIIQCKRSCAGLLPYATSDKIFRRGILNFNGESLNLEEIQVFAIQQIHKKTEVIFHINHIYPR